MKKIMSEPGDWQIIITFLQSITVPFAKSIIAAKVLEAVNRAKEVEIEEKI